ncbi:MAG: GNAT family N-acetyltransferase [Deltaproteobacteria bacterium]|nr:GNAT family N-acetyltransferase [Deltaproteobacteria bacterium]
MPTIKVPPEPPMINYVAYRKFVTLKNGKRVMFRFLNEQDRDTLIQMFQEAPEEDTRYLKQDVKNINLVNFWIDHINYRKVLPLVAVDLESNRLVADATLHRGKHAAKHIGEIRIFVCRAFRNLGLGSAMLEELINLAMKEGLQWLKAEIIADHKKVIKAFREKGFETRATLEDYFIRKDGMTHDVVLMMRPVVKREEAEF